LTVIGNNFPSTFRLERAECIYNCMHGTW